MIRRPPRSTLFPEPRALRGIREEGPRARRREAAASQGQHAPRPGPNPKPLVGARSVSRRGYARGSGGRGAWPAGDPRAARRGGDTLGVRRRAGGAAPRWRAGLLGNEGGRAQRGGALRVRTDTGNPEGAGREPLRARGGRWGGFRFGREAGDRTVWGGLVGLGGRAEVHEGAGRAVGRRSSRVVEAWTGHKGEGQVTLGVRPRDTRHPWWLCRTPRHA